MEKRFSLKNKLVLIFGALIAIGSLVEGLLAVNIARKAVVEKIEVNLTDKAGDVAEIIDGRISAFFQFLDGLARMPEIRDDSIPLIEKNASASQRSSGKFYDTVIIHCGHKRNHS